MVPMKTRKRKRAPGGGRKPLDPKGKVDVFIRLPLKLGADIDRLAKKHRRKRPAEIRAALMAWCRRHFRYEPHIEALIAAIGLVADGVERRTGKKWNEDLVTGAALREEVDRLISHFAPRAPEPPVIPDDVGGVGGFVIALIENAQEERYGLPRYVDDAFYVDDGMWPLLRDLGSGYKRNRRIITGQ